MNLPHREPIIFAKEILERSNERVSVRCVFPFIPTLAMFIEAAAQSSSAFHNDKKAKIGFLTMASNVKTLNKIIGKAYLFYIYKESEVGQYKKFSFVAEDTCSTLQIVSGNFTIYVKN